MLKIVLGFLAFWFIAMFGGLGCGPPQAFPKEFAHVAEAVAVSATDQAIWQDVLTRLHGQVIEPGIEVRAGVLYVAGAKLTGASGQVSIEATGIGSGQLSEAARSKILGLFPDDPDIAGRVLAIIEADQAARRTPASQPSGELMPVTP